MEKTSKESCLVELILTVNIKNKIKSCNRDLRRVDFGVVVVMGPRFKQCLAVPPLRKVTAEQRLEGWKSQAPRHPIREKV